MNIVFRKILRKANSIKLNIFEGKCVKCRVKLLNHFNVQTLIDVGANTGQYGYYTRKAGYKNKIISIEPLTKPYQILESFARHDPNWETVNTAVGNMDGEIEMNVSANLLSSSILCINKRHVDVAPESAYIGKEKVQIMKIDTLVDRLSISLDSTFLKTDTQGYGKVVLEGAEQSLKKIKGLQLELSLTELYEGETLFSEMINFILERGFTIYSLEPGFCDKSTGQLLQTDVIFFRD